jgi:hypothetical protein
VREKRFANHRRSQLLLLVFIVHNYPPRDFE